MSKAGIKTQLALADRMAAMEGLSEPPRQVVNKVLREQPVDIQTLARVARALNVPIYSLYLTADDVDRTSIHADKVPSQPEKTPDIVSPPGVRDLPAEATATTPSIPDALSTSTAVPVPTATVRRRVGFYALGVLCAAVLAGLLWRYRPSSAASAVAVTHGAAVIRVGISKLQGDDDGSLRRALLRASSNGITWYSADTGETRTPLSPDAGDGVLIDAKLVHSGRLVNLRVSVLDAGRRETIWSDVHSGALNASQMADSATAALVKYVRGQNRPAPPSDAAMDEFLQGRLQLDSSPNELNLRRAQSQFEAALRADPNLAVAAAGLCETLVRQSWIRDEARVLTDAEAVCNRARALDGDLPQTRVAYADLLRRSGRTAESALLLTEVLVKEPGNTDAMLSLVDAGVAEFLKSGERHFLEAAQSRARDSVALEPGFWRTHWQLGVVEWHLGNLDAAIGAYEEARRLDANEYVLGNLGTMYFCSGAVARARDAYLQARETGDNPHLGDELMGMFYYYLRDFDHSLQYRKRAVDSFSSDSGPEIHQIWGDLGDSYRRDNQPILAAQAYAKATQILAQDLAAGNATEGDKGYRAYYAVASMKASGRSLSADQKALVIRDLTEAYAADTEPGALVRIAIAWHFLGEPARAQQATARAAGKCRAYRDHPDLQDAG
jgi:tetratricopeptide (TPR) repeat protein